MLVMGIWVSRCVASLRGMSFGHFPRERGKPFGRRVPAPYPAISLRLLASPFASKGDGLRATTRVAPTC